MLWAEVIPGVFARLLAASINPFPDVAAPDIGLREGARYRDDCFLMLPDRDSDEGSCDPQPQLPLRHHFLIADRSWFDALEK